MGIFNVFSTLTPKQVFCKTKTFSKNWGTVFKFKVLRLRTHHLHTKQHCQMPMLRQTEWKVQNVHITMNRFFSLATF